jgi:hypothetical protein
MNAQLRVAIVCLLLLSTACAYAMPTQGTAPATNSTTDTEVKREEIRKLIELTGAAKVSAAALKQIIAPMRQAFPQVPEGFWSEFLSEVRADELVDLIVPIYDKYYTRDDIHELTKFYQSPVGQKTIKVLPQLSAEAIDAGQEWGRGVADRAMKKLQEKGYDKSSSSQGAPPSSGK